LTGLSSKSADERTISWWEEKMKNICKLSALFLVVFLVILGMGSAFSQKAGKAWAFPSRPIEIVIPFSAGGGGAVWAETIKKIVTDGNLSPQPLYTTYKPGANGAIGWSYVVGRKGDAHTIAMVGGAFLIGPAAGQSPLDPVNDFTPISVMAFDEVMMVTRSNSPYRKLQDVIDASKKAPKSVKYAGSGTTSSDALVGFMLESQAGIKFNLIPFEGGGDLVVAILGGHVDLAMGNPLEFLPQIEAGKLRALAIASAQRVPALKDVPTFKELGYDDVLWSIARGMTAPPGIGKSEQEWLISLMKKVTEFEAWKKYTDKNMMTRTFISGDENKKFFAESTTKLKETMTGMGLYKKK
jgi:putative tricarboxylic transport membrane protein